MNLFHNCIRQKESIIYRSAPNWRLHLFLSFFLPLISLLLIFLPSCIDEKILPDSPSIPPVGNLSLFDLPATFGLNVSEIDNGPSDTRNDNSTNTSDGNTLFDGSPAEYDLINPSIQDEEDKKSEFYHYLLLYDKSNANAKPLILPIDIENIVYDANRYNHLTLTIKKVLANQSNSDLIDNDALANLKSGSDLVQILKNYQPYVLLNFKLIDGDNRNYSLDGKEITVNNKQNSSTPEKLSTLTAANLEKLQLKDYKITAKKVYNSGQTGEKPITYNSNFFIMSSSVYSNGTNKIIDGTVVPENIFSDEEQALSKPALIVYVERLASKITVDFDMKKMGQAQFDFGGTNTNNSSEDDNFLQDNTPKAAPQPVTAEYDPVTGLPVIHLNVRRVDMTNGTGITFDNSGYKINSIDNMKATIRIVGFGVSNLETQENLFKYVKNTYDPSWNWRDVNNHRCYWSEDSHYDLERPSGNFTKTKGYPHQYRLALDTDSVTSYHAGNYTGNSYVSYQLDYKDPNAGEYVNYTSLGKPTDEKIDGVYLKYKSYNDLINDFKGIGFSKMPDGYEYDPLYSLENTYVDQGMLSGANWRWPWQREPYAAATNLMLMATIEVDDNPYIKDGNIDPNVANDLYLGQNNIFYLKKENFLKSKLAILNQVMLSGGNAGLQILHGQWDRHSRWDEDDENQYKDTHLDKVAWNEGSYLWFAETEVYEDSEYKGKPKYDKIINDKGEVSYKVKLKEGGTVRLKVDDNITDYLDLIPAEISGGDGQRLIAPAEKYMAVNYRYYLSPAKLDESGKEILDSNNNPVMDEAKAVEISFNHLVALIHKIIGPVDVYRGGRMYYSVPIPHRWLSFGPQTNTDKWKEIGAFGLVRNNWYSITVDQINKLGTPVDDADQPIVPVMDVKRSYINMGVKLKDWHEMKQDNIPVM